jgi:hypothetical protein
MALSLKKTPDSCSLHSVGSAHFRALQRLGRSRKRDALSILEEYGTALIRNIGMHHRGVSVAIYVAGKALVEFAPNSLTNFPTRARPALETLESRLEL